MEKPKIYFDNAATTPPLFFECGELGNPSSPHAAGLRAERALNAARKEMAAFLGEAEIIFTSGGTEANNLAVLGFALANKRRGITIQAAPWEHPSVTEPIKFAQELGLAEAVSAPLSGVVSAPLSVGNSRGPRLACFSHVSSETGDIADIAALAAALKAENPETIVFVDGAQGFCKEKTDLGGVDLYSFSGHKFHGAAGVGGLVSKVRLVPIMRGGSQENGLRAGTENLRGILQTAAAAKTLFAAREENRARVLAVKNELLALTRELPDVLENALSATVSPYILNMSFRGVKGETLVHLLSEKGIYASMGAACRSRKKQQSALEVMGFSKERAESAVRFSFSHLNTVAEATAAREIIAAHVAQMRRVLGRK